MLSFVRTVIWIAIAAALVRGLFVFDMGPSAKDTYPVASAICLVGALIAAILMLSTPNDSSQASNQYTLRTLLIIMAVCAALFAMGRLYLM